MSAGKPQIKSLFATPVAIHYLPVAHDVNLALRPLIVERAGQLAQDKRANGQGWRSQAGIEAWAGEPLQTLFRVARDLADGLTTTRSGGRVHLDWTILASASVRQKGEYREFATSAGAYWSGVYYVDDGYAKSDDAALGGECELADPRGSLPLMVGPSFGYRIPGGATPGEADVCRPQTGMIVLHPAWLARGERRYEGDHTRVTIEFDLTPPA